MSFNKSLVMQARRSSIVGVPVSDPSNYDTLNFYYYVRTSNVYSIPIVDLMNLIAFGGPVVGPENRLFEAMEAHI